MKSQHRIAVGVAVLVVVAGVLGFVFKKRFFPEKDPKALASLARLLADDNKPQEPISSLVADFDKLGCEKKWRMQPRDEEWRSAEVRRLLKAAPKLEEWLKEADSPSALFVRARLLELGLAQREPGSDDAQTLMAQAEAGGNGDAIFRHALRLMREFPVYDNVTVDAGKFDEINALLKTAAERGNAGAAYHLGIRTQPFVQQHAHDDGRKLPQNVPVQERREERRWFCLSAELGDPRGQSSCARVIFDGIGGPRDMTAGVNWLRKAAENGDNIAAYDLARRYEYGRDVQQDLDAAREWYCRAISLGNQWSGKALRQPAFGSLVKEEPAPEKSKPKVAKGPSFKDYRKRIKTPPGLRLVKFTASQKKVLAELRRQFDNPPLGNTPDLPGLEKLNCPASIIKGAKKAKENGQATHPYRHGGPELEQRVKNLLAKDSKLAKTLWTAKDADAEYVAGMILKGRIAAPPDDSSSEVTDKGYLRAADLAGSVSARYALLNIYLFEVAYTLGAPQGRTQEVLAELEQLAKGGSGGAALDLSEHYGFCKYGMCSGRKDFVPLDQRVEVRDWACRSAKLGFVPGMAACGAHHMEGLGGSKDEVQGIKLLGSAALAGDGQAAKRLSSHFERVKDLKAYNAWKCRGLANGAL